MLHDEAKHNLLLPVHLQLILNDWIAGYFDAFASDEEICWFLSRLDILVMLQILEVKLLVVVLLLLIDVEILAVEVKQTVGQLVASQSAHDKLAGVSTEHATPWEVARCSSGLLLGCNFITECFLLAFKGFWGHLFSFL